MSFTAAVVTYLAGIVAAGLLYRFLRGRMPEALASGLGVAVLLFGLHPLASRLDNGAGVKFEWWLLFCAVGALAAAGVSSLLRPKR